MYIVIKRNVNQSTKRQTKRDTLLADLYNFMKMIVNFVTCFPIFLMDPTLFLGTLKKVILKANRRVRIRSLLRKPYYYQFLEYTVPKFS